MTLSFKYRSVLINKNLRILKPLIPLTIEAKDKIDFLGLIDSGSDMTILPREIAKVLEIGALDRVEELSGITGEKVLCRQCKIKIRIGSSRESYSLEIPALIPEKDGLDLVIGRMGFFTEFKISFIEFQRKIELKKIELRRKY